MQTRRAQYNWYFIEIQSQPEKENHFIQIIWKKSWLLNAKFAKILMKIKNEGGCLWTAITSSIVPSFRYCGLCIFALFPSNNRNKFDNLIRGQFTKTAYSAKRKSRLVIYKLNTLQFCLKNGKKLHFWQKSFDDSNLVED